MVLNTLNVGELSTEYVRLAGAHLNKESKFYDEDMCALIKAALKKSKIELIESIQRMQAIANVSEKEIKKHCMVDSLI